MLAIQGHPTRGKEVIQILESLGGINASLFKGTEDFWYFINSHNYIVNDYKFVLTSAGFKTYTLEEFEKKFPLKIGETVITTLNHVGTIIGIVNSKYKVLFKEDSALVAPRRLKPYKEMKEERNITLTLDKAKEWYKKGGELKEIALQAFTEKELNLLPRSWEEFATSHARRGYYISSDGKPLMCASSGKFSSPHVCPSKKSAEAHLAMIQLEQLRNCWWNGWEPEWNNSEKHVIKWEKDSLIVFTARRVHAFLVFPTREMAEEFLECFRDLIEKAGDLI